MRYFFGLDAFRAIAATLVILGHVELVKKSEGYPNIYDNLPFFMSQGSLAVTFFFVLSGFLITYLLLIEKDKHGTISIHSFYLRRIFRIWPLYFLLTFIGFCFLFLSHGIGTKNLQSFYFYLAVLPNLASQPNPLAYQSWSIGVEEQFYIFWPWLFFLSNRKLFRYMTLIIPAIYGIRALPFLLLKIGFIDTRNFLFCLNNFFDTARFDNMAIGGILAFCMHTNKIYLPIKYRYLMYLLTCCLLCLKVNFSFGLQNIIYSVIFALNIYYIIQTTTAESWLESSFLKYLGKVSYGIYMWHLVAIFLILSLLKNFFSFHNKIDNLILHFSAIFLSYILASLSYELFEKKFLALKFKYANRA
ncbi:MAG: acyltransferase [Geobacteraceae bacterium]|nr:acyltransferase [Geobacteraceae bacterium]